VERGLADTSVGLVLAHAKVSSRTLYGLFPGGLEDCLLAVLDEMGRRVIALAAGRLGAAASWQQGVRETLAALLVLFDSEPGLSRVCFVEALGGGQVVVERREASVAAFRELIVPYVERTTGQHVSPLMAESAIASVMSVIYARLLRREQTPLVELLGPLMGLLMAPVGASKQIVHEETKRGAELARAIRAGAAGWAPTRTGSHPDARAQLPLPALLTNPSARRARQCLLYIAGRVQCGHHPSNGEVGSAIGVQNKGQISRLLSQLQQEGLLAKRTAGVAVPNEWALTQRGEAVADVLADSDSQALGARSAPTR
jgi:AcrR family transcriptional regulator